MCCLKIDTETLLANCLNTCKTYSFSPDDLQQIVRLMANATDRYIFSDTGDDALHEILTHSHPLRSGILALCNKRWLEVFLRNRVEFTAVFELTLDLLNYGLSPFVQQLQSHGPIFAGFPVLLQRRFNTRLSEPLRLE